MAFFLFPWPVSPSKRGQRVDLTLEGWQNDKDKVCSLYKCTHSYKCNSGTILKMGSKLYKRNRKESLSSVHHVRF